jgi:hypothetical protein
MAKTKLTPGQKAARKAARTKKMNAMPHRARSVVKGHVGIDAGMIGTGFLAATGNQGGFGSPIDYAKNGTIPLGNRITSIGKSVGKNLSEPKTYLPMGVGLVVSASPKIPGIRILAKPLDRELKKRFKMGL